MWSTILYPFFCPVVYFLKSMLSFTYYALISPLNILRRRTSVSQKARGSFDAGYPVYIKHPRATYSVCVLINLVWHRGRRWVAIKRYDS